MDPLLWVLFFRQDLQDNQNNLSVFLMKTDKHNFFIAGIFGPIAGPNNVMTRGHEKRYQQLCCFIILLNVHIFKKNQRKFSIITTLDTIVFHRVEK
jgi:hypothetical protein